MTTPPVPEMSGRFSLYNTPDGGFHIAYQQDATDEIPEPETKHMEVPGTIVRASKMVADMQDSGEKITPAKMFKILGPMISGLS